MPKVSYYVLKPILDERAPNSIDVQVQKDELFLGPHVRLSGLSGMALLESEELAREFAEACAPVIQKRYGPGSSIEVVRCEASAHPSIATKIQRDSEIVRKRLATNNLAPNKAP